MAKVFISQPMKGLTDEQIKAKRAEIIESATKVVHEYFGASEPVDILESFFESAPDNAKPLWFIGESIKVLAEADVVYFCKGWKDARGCKIENICSHEYGVPLIFEEDANDDVSAKMYSNK